MSVNRDKLDNFGGFSINVSGHSINDETFPDFVLEQFSKSQAPTSKVCFEITETAAVASFSQANRFIQALRDLADETGLGKTIVFADIARRVVSKGGRVLVLAGYYRALAEAIDRCNEAVKALDWPAWERTYL